MKRICGRTIKPSNAKQPRRTGGPSPGVRAIIETIKKHKLEETQALALSILCDCGGDWNQVQAFFQRPKIVAQGGWEQVQTMMNSQRPALDELFLGAAARLVELKIE